MCAITFVIQHCVVCISSVLKRLYILALLAQQYVCVCVSHLCYPLKRSLFYEQCEHHHYFIFIKSWKTWNITVCALNLHHNVPCQRKSSVIIFVAGYKCVYTYLALCF